MIFPISVWWKRFNQYDCNCNCNCDETDPVVISWYPYLDMARRLFFSFLRRHSHFLHPRCRCGLQRQHAQPPNLHKWFNAIWKNSLRSAILQYCSLIQMWFRQCDSIHHPECHCLSLESKGTILYLSHLSSFCDSKTCVVVVNCTPYEPISISTKPTNKKTQSKVTIVVPKYTYTNLEEAKDALESLELLEKSCRCPRKNQMASV